MLPHLASIDIEVHFLELGVIVKRQRQLAEGMVPLLALDNLEEINFRPKGVLEGWLIDLFQGNTLKGQPVNQGYPGKACQFEIFQRDHFTHTAFLGQQ